MNKLYVNCDAVFKKTCWVILAVLLCAHLSVAQSTLVLPKCDSLHFLADSSQVIFYSKKKNGAYDLTTKSLLIKPTKNPILYLNSANLYLQITKDGFRVDHFVNGTNKFNYTANNYDQFEAIFSAKDDEMYKNVVLFQHMIYDRLSGETNDPDSIFTQTFQPETFFRLDPINEKQMLINYYRTPIESLLLFEEIYWVDSGFGQSGVFNKQTKNWDVPPIYKTCELKDSLLFCVKDTPHFAYADPDFEDPFVWYSAVFDVYVLRGDKFISRAKNVNALTNEFLIDLMGWDDVEILADSIHVIVTENGKKGLWQIELNNYSTGNFEQSALVLNEILPIEYDLIYYNCEDRLLFSYNENSTQKFALHLEEIDSNGNRNIKNSLRANESIYYGRDISDNPTTEILIDGMSVDFTAFLNNKVSDIKQITRVKRDHLTLNFDRACGLSFLNDSLIKIVNFMSDSTDNYAMPLHSYDYPDEDSIAINQWGDWGNVYPPPFPGYEKTGVFNIQSQNWLIAPEYRDLSSNYGQFLTESELLSDGNRRPDGSVYSFLNTSNEWVFREITLDQLVNDFKAFQPQLINENEIKVSKPYSENSGFASYDENPPRKLFYAQKNDGNYEIYDFVLDWRTLHLEPISCPKELIHYNMDLDYFVYLENDSIHLEWEDSTFSVLAQNGSIEINPTHATESLVYEIILRDSVNEYSFTKAPSAHYYASLKKAKYTLIGNRFIISEEMFYDDINTYYFDIDMYWDSPPVKTYQYFDMETSTIWEKKDSVWYIISPTYSLIQVHPFGFAVRTGGYEILNIKTGENEIVKDGRWLFLDENLKPMSFYDYFDFEYLIVHDFGLELSTATGWFLISLDGIVITSAEWDRFELEDGQIKAIKYTEESMFNLLNYGEEPIEEKIEYFDFP